MYTVDEALKFFDTNTSINSNSQKPDFKKIDEEVLGTHTSILKQQGITEKSLKEAYKKIPNFGGEYTFGLGIGRLPSTLYSGNLGENSKYIDARLNILNELIAQFESVKSPEDLHKLNAFIEMSKKAAGGEDKAYHYQEASQAAKHVVMKDPEARQNLQDYEKSFIYDTATFQKTLNELVARRDHLQAIKDQGFDSFNEHGWAGRVSDHGLTTAIQTAGIVTTVKGALKSGLILEGIGDIRKGLNTGIDEDILKEIESHRTNIANFQSKIALAEKARKGAKVKRSIPAWKGQITKLNNALRKLPSPTGAGDEHIKTGLAKTPIAGRLFKWSSQAYSAIGKHGSKLLGALGPWGKAAVLGGALIIGGSKLIVAYNNKDSFIHNIGGTIQDTLKGDAKNWLVALGSWILPGYGSLYGANHFHTERDKKLEELKLEAKGAKV
ncbi:MAG: hypothetical protein LW817_08210 [Candidatus Caenarcaniphilales bacterium]|jgi:hypothetical protein|nr:hypothetical protein [Candidatus Caenarcaniphilales bacterium]